MLIVEPVPADATSAGKLLASRRGAEIPTKQPLLADKRIVLP
jgi:hypothetical protein